MREGKSAQIGSVPRHLAGKAVRLLGERRRLRVEIHEDEVAEHLHLHGSEQDAVRIEILDQLRAARSMQAAFEIVDPRMVRTGDARRRAGTAQQLVSAVPAHVVEGAQRTVLAANREDAPTLNPAGEIAARLAQRLLVAEVEPAPPEDLLALGVEVSLIDVAVRADRSGPGGDRVVARACVFQLPRCQSCRHGAVSDGRAPKAVPVVPGGQTPRAAWTP